MLAISPNPVMKSISACAPGELIRMPWRDGTSLALVSFVGQHRSIICLQGGDPAKTLPFHAPILEELSVLSYGRDFALHVDQSSARIADNTAMQKCGVLIRSDKTLLLRVSSEDAGEDRFYDWNTEGMDTPEPSAEECATFTQWSLAVGDIVLLIFPKVPALTVHRALSSGLGG